MCILIKFFVKGIIPLCKKRFLVYSLLVKVFFILFLLVNSGEVYYTDVKTTADLTSPSGNIRYMLLWTNPKASPFVYFGKGQTVFKNKSCRYTNCHVTGNRNYLDNYELFDAILFNGPQLLDAAFSLPKRRSPHQKYIYANIESAANYPMCSKQFNGYFNWTWTYRLDSDSIWSYFAVKDATNGVIGPKIEMQWIPVSEMDDIDDELKEKLERKTKAAAWFASNCKTLSNREDYVSKIRNHLRNFSLDVDVYGECGDHQCPRDINDRCLTLLEKEYFFYFAFENSFSVDYVTEKILYAYTHNTVPVVFGGANYSRFLPGGTYLNAYELGPEKLALKMNEVIKNPQLYYKFFRWKKYYSFHFKHHSPDTDDYCKFCAMLNDDKLMRKTSIYDDFDLWWNENASCHRHRNKHAYDDIDFSYSYESVELKP